MSGEDMTSLYKGIELWPASSDSYRMSTNPIQQSRKSTHHDQISNRGVQTWDWNNVESRFNVSSLGRCNGCKRLFPQLRCKGCSLCSTCSGTASSVRCDSCSRGFVCSVCFVCDSCCHSSLITSSNDPTVIVDVPVSYPAHLYPRKLCVTKTVCVPVCPKPCPPPCPQPCPQPCPPPCPQPCPPKPCPPPCPPKPCPPKPCPPPCPPKPEPCCCKGFTYRGVYDCKESYVCNDVVRVEGKKCNPGKIYVYTSCEPCSKIPPWVNCDENSPWKLMLIDGVCENKCSPCDLDPCDEPPKCKKRDKCKCKKCKNPCDTSETDTEECTTLCKKKKCDDDNKKCPTFKGKWRSSRKYNTCDIVEYQNIFYIAAKKSCGKNPATECQFWDVFLTGSVKFKGCWKKDHCYFINDIVRSECGSYIALSTVPKNIHVTDENYWALLCQDGQCCCNKCDDTHVDTSSYYGYKCKKEDKCVVEKKMFGHHDLFANRAIDQTTESEQPNNTYTETETVAPTSRYAESYNRLSTTEYPDKRRNHRDNFSSEIISFSDSKHAVYYATKTSDIKYSLMPKWKVPILIDNIIQKDSDTYDSKHGHITFTSIGLYKVTINVTFTGVNNFATVCYLLKPTENPDSDSYRRERKIRSSAISMPSSTHTKNRLNYTFVVHVPDMLSTMILVSSHGSGKSKNHSSNNEVTVYGKDCTWILVERLD